MLKPPSFDFNLDRFNEKDDRTIALLFKEYYTPLVNIARQYLPDLQTAEDRVMNVFTKLLGTTNKQYKTLSQVLGTLVTATRNECLTYITRNRLRPRDPLYFQDRNEHAGESLIFRKYLIDAISSIIKKMPPRQRQVMELRADEELTFQQIAERLNISVATVQGHIEAGRKTIEEKLKAELWNLSWVLLLLWLLLGIFLKN